MNIQDSPSNVRLPPWVKLIDVSYPALIKAHGIDGPICHVGSLINKEDVKDSQVNKFRNLFSDLPNPEFVGIDIFAGKNVDVVADLCAPNFQQSHPELLDKFGFMICRALLEHVEDPFAAARNIASMIKPGGHLFFAGPWVWGYHPYPNDYWRISFEGVKLLFRGFDWKEWWYSGTVRNRGIKIEDINRERSLFAQSDLSGEIAGLITDRSMAYLNVGAIGQRQG